MMSIPNVHFSHTAVPSFSAGLCSRGPLKRLGSPAIKREKLKIKEGGGSMAEREEEDKGSQLAVFPLHSTTTLNILTAQKSRLGIEFFSKLKRSADGGELLVR